MRYALYVAVCMVIAWHTATGETLRLNDAVILTAPPPSPVVEKAAQVLQEEIQKRSGIRLVRSTEAPRGDVPLLMLEKVALNVPDSHKPSKPEGYSVWLGKQPQGAPIVHVVGFDDRGALFGAGRLLRALNMTPGTISIDKTFGANESPHFRIRGHELGYRNKSNTYDAWDLDRFEQYIRELAIFGVNTIQLTCELEHMDREGRHMACTAWDMTPNLVDCIHSYGLNVWLWLPPGGKAFDPNTAQQTLRRCEELFQRCKKIDAVFIPGGDPGDAHPRVLLPWVEKMAALLRSTHPGAEVWISNEDMPHEWNEFLFEYLVRQKPDWLNGVVFGTWVKLSLEKMRSRVPECYPIVQYVDITHCIECQYPVANWDRAFAYTLGREPINPRPNAMEQIFTFTAPYTEGFIGYSDGVNDDLNKIVWAAKSWNPDTPLREILQEYSRFFTGPTVTDEAVLGWISLEKNWNGPLHTNKQVLKTLKHWQTIQRKIKAPSELGWRTKMGVFRAYYDAYVYKKLLADTKRENETLAFLQKALDSDSETYLEHALRKLDEPYNDHELTKLRENVERLGEELFREIGIQMSVPKYGAANWERGAVLDALDMPLNDAIWLKNEINNIIKTQDPLQQRQQISTILNWEKPTANGYYDDLGNPEKQPHLVITKQWKDDPGFVESPQNEFIEIQGREAWKQSWRDQAQTLYGTPLRLQYKGLEKNTPYTLQVLYTGRFKPVMRLMANGTYEIHSALPQPSQVCFLKFPIPQEATNTGSLLLEWFLEQGRGCQVAEVWLIPEPASP